MTSSADRGCDARLQGIVKQGLTEFGPKPLLHRRELPHETANAVLAAGEMVGQERPHQRPAQARTFGHGGVDLLGGSDALFEQMDRLPENRRLEPVGDVAEDLLAQTDRPLAEAGIEGLGDVERPVFRRRAPDDLDQRNEMRRIERVAENDPSRPRTGALHHRHHDRR